MKLTDNFTLEEFQTGGTVPSHLMDNVRALAHNVQRIRDEIGKPIRIHSGFRLPANNSGVPKSQHLLAKAADLKVRGMTSEDLHAVILKLIRDGEIAQGGVGLYPGRFVHYDIRQGRAARWRAKKR